jgi:diguanylate cyclase (GGDEF)-like protein/PAS domain S-box-containing protein
VFAQIPAGLLAAALSWIASTSARAEPRTRRGWRYLAGAFVLYALGDLTWLTIYLGVHEADAINVTRVFYFAHYVLVMVGLVAFQQFPKTRQERVKFGLDAGTVFLGGLMAVWYFVIGPIAALGRSDRGTVFAQLLFALADLQILLGIAVHGVRRGEERYRLAFVTLLSGLVALLAGDVIYAQNRLAGTSGDGGPADFVFMIRWLLVGLAAFLHARASNRASASVERDPQQSTGMLPLAAVTVGYGTLAASAIGQWSSTEGGLILAAVGLTCVVMARQISTLRENVRLATEAAARQTEARFRSLVQNASDLIIVVDNAGIVRYQSPSAERVLGYGSEALIGTRIAALLPADDSESVLAQVERTRGETGVSTQAEWRLRRGDGRWIRAEIIATNLRDDPNVGGVVLTIRDIEERKQFEEKLRYQALHDGLTGLPNRAMLADRVLHAKARSERGGLPTSLLLLDLDDFKTINDRFGHSAGDEVLGEVARRLETCIRTSDTPARLGGDEFAVLLEDTRDEHAAVEVAERIAAALRDPIDVAGEQVTISASVGIVVSGQGELEGEIFRNADLAMYQAKKNGAGLREVYEPGMHTAVLERLQLEADLRHAVELGQIVVHFQPIVDLRTGRWLGAEALVRWQHPTRGFTLPSQFISVAETTGLIVSIGRHVLEEACRFAGEWGRGYYVSVNLSARQLQEANIVRHVAAALRHTGLHADQLILEITESVLMVETETTIRRLNELKTSGIRVAIDDFGTGYSSLAYLQNLPVDILKLDQSFIHGLDGGDLSPIARGVIDLGRALNLQIVAEGIEQPEEVQALLRAGCSLGQGYHFAKPLEPLTLRKRFQEGQGVVA